MHPPIWCTDLCPPVTAILKQAELGTAIADLLRQHRVSEQSYYRWKKLYGGTEPSEARELRLLRAENAKLKKLVGNCRWTR